MKPRIKLHSVLIATLFVISLTLPAFADTRPPAPKIEMKFEKMYVATLETAINYEAYPDIGMIPQLKAVKFDAVADIETPTADLYLEAPVRPCPAFYGYIVQRPCKVMVGKIRSPNKE